MYLLTNLGNHTLNGAALRITGVARNIRTSRITHEYLDAEAGVIGSPTGGRTSSCSTPRASSWGRHSLRSPVPQSSR